MARDPENGEYPKEKGCSTLCCFFISRPFQEQAPDGPENAKTIKS
jgi:hypothetical protein